MTELGIGVFKLMLWGGVATAVLSGFQYAAQSLGISRLSFPLLIGTFFTEERGAATLIGLLLYGFGGWIFAALYFLIFASLGHSGWLLGAVFGLIHGALLMAVIMPILPYLHPRMSTPHDGPAATNRLHPPGFFAFNYGYPTPLVTLLAHACYGAVLGGTMGVG